MLYFSEHANRGCSASQNIQTGDAILPSGKTNGMLYFSEHTNGDDILLRTNKWGMQYFSEQTNGGCYTSQSKQTGDAILLRANKRG